MNKELHQIFQLLFSAIGHGANAAAAADNSELEFLASSFTSPLNDQSVNQIKLWIEDARALEIDKKTLANMLGDFMIGASSLQGNSTYKVPDFLAKYFARLESKNIQPKLKSGPIPSKSFSKLFKQCFEWEEGLFYPCYLQSITDNSTSIVVKNIINTIKKLPDNHFCLIPFGWHGRPSGHIMLLQITRTKDTYSAISVTTGNGIDPYHSGTYKNYKLYTTPAVLIENIPREKMESEVLFEILHDLKSTENPLINYSSFQIYELFIASLGGTPVPNKFVDAVSAQRGGTCSWKAYTAWLQTILPEREYKEFIIRIKLISTLCYLIKHGDELNKDAGLTNFLYECSEKLFHTINKFTQQFSDQPNELLPIWLCINWVIRSAVLQMQAPGLKRILDFNQLLTFALMPKQSKPKPEPKTNMNSLPIECDGFKEWSSLDGFESQLIDQSASSIPEYNTGTLASYLEEQFIKCKPDIKNFIEVAQTAHTIEQIIFNLPYPHKPNEYGSLSSEERCKIACILYHFAFKYAHYDYIISTDKINSQVLVGKCYALIYHLNVLENPSIYSFYIPVINTKFLKHSSFYSEPETKVRALELVAYFSSFPTYKQQLDYSIFNESAYPEGQLYIKYMKNNPVFIAEVEKKYNRNILNLSYRQLMIETHLYSICNGQMLPETTFFLQNCALLNRILYQEFGLNINTFLEAKNSLFNVDLNNSSVESNYTIKLGNTIVFSIDIMKPTPLAFENATITPNLKISTYTNSDYVTENVLLMKAAQLKPDRISQKMWQDYALINFVENPSIQQVLGFIKTHNANLCVDTVLNSISALTKNPNFFLQVDFSPHALIELIAELIRTASLYQDLQSKTIATQLIYSAVTLELSLWTIKKDYIPNLSSFIDLLTKMVHQDITAPKIKLLNLIYCKYKINPNCSQEQLKKLFKLQILTRISAISVYGAPFQFIDGKEFLLNHNFQQDLNYALTKVENQALMCQALHLTFKNHPLMKEQQVTWQADIKDSTVFVSQLKDQMISFNFNRWELKFADKSVRQVPEVLYNSLAYKLLLHTKISLGIVEESVSETTMTVHDNDKIIHFKYDKLSRTVTAELTVEKPPQPPISGIVAQDICSLFEEIPGNAFTLIDSMGTRASYTQNCIKYTEMIPASRVNSITSQIEYGYLLAWYEDTNKISYYANIPETLDNVLRDFSLGRSYYVLVDSTTNQISKLQVMRFSLSFTYSAGKLLSKQNPGYYISTIQEIPAFGTFRSYLLLNSDTNSESLALIPLGSLEICEENTLTLASANRLKQHEGLTGYVAIKLDETKFPKPKSIIEHIVLAQIYLSQRLYARAFQSLLAARSPLLYSKTIQNLLSSILCINKNINFDLHPDFIHCILQTAYLIADNLITNVLNINELRELYKKLQTTEDFNSIVHRSLHTYNNKITLSHLPQFESFKIDTINKLLNITSALKINTLKKTWIGTGYTSLIVNESKDIRHLWCKWKSFQNTSLVDKIQALIKGMSNYSFSSVPVPLINIDLEHWLTHISDDIRSANNENGALKKKRLLTRIQFFRRSMCQIERNAKFNTNTETLLIWGIYLEHFIQHKLSIKTNKPLSNQIRMIIETAHPFIVMNGKNDETITHQMSSVIQLKPSSNLLKYSLYQYESRNSNIESIIINPYLIEMPQSYFSSKTIENQAPFSFDIQEKILNKHTCEYLSALKKALNDQSANAIPCINPQNSKLLLKEINTQLEVTKNALKKYKEQFAQNCMQTSVDSQSHPLVRAFSTLKTDALDFILKERSLFQNVSSSTITNNLQKMLLNLIIIHCVHNRLTRIAKTVESWVENDMEQFGAEVEKVYDDLMDTRIYNSDTDLDLILFEFFNGIRPTRDQLQVVTKLEQVHQVTSNSKSNNLVLCKPTGFGKSMVVTPILLNKLGDGKHLVIYVVPMHLFEETCVRLDRLLQAYNKMVVPFCYNLNPVQNEALLDKIIQNFNEAIHRKNIIVTTAASLQKIDIDFIKEITTASSLKKSHTSQRTVKLRQIKHILKHSSRVVLDEADGVLNDNEEQRFALSTSYSLNWEYIDLMGDLFYSFYIKHKDLSNKYALIVQQYSAADQINTLQNEKKAIVEEFIRREWVKLGIDSPIYLDLSHFAEYLVGIHANAPNWVLSASELIKDKIAIVKESFTRSFQNFVNRNIDEHFIVGKPGDIAVPPENGKPKKDSYFENPLETFYATCFCYFFTKPNSVYISEASLGAIVKPWALKHYSKLSAQINKNNTRTTVENPFKEIGINDIRQLNDMAALDLIKLIQTKGRHLLLSYLKEEVFTKIALFPQNIKHDHLNFVDMLNTLTCFSAIPWNITQFHESIEQEGNDILIVAKTLRYLKQTSSIMNLPDAKNTDQLLRCLLELQTTAQSRVLVDTGAYFSSMKPAQLALDIMSLAKKLQLPYEGICYFNNANQLVVLNQNNILTLLSEFSGTRSNLFYYLSHAQAIGTDIDVPLKNARAWLTCSNHMLLRDLVQGVGRMRRWDKDQRVTLCLANNFIEPILCRINQQAITIEKLAEIYFINQLRQIDPRAVQSTRRKDLAIIRREVIQHLTVQTLASRIPANALSAYSNFLRSVHQFAPWKEYGQASYVVSTIPYFTKMVSEQLKPLSMAKKFVDSITKEVSNLHAKLLKNGYLPESTIITDSSNETISLEIEIQTQNSMDLVINKTSPIGSWCSQFLDTFLHPNPNKPFVFMPFESYLGTHPQANWMARLANFTTTNISNLSLINPNELNMLDEIAYNTNPPEFAADNKFTIFSFKAKNLPQPTQNRIERSFFTQRRCVLPILPLDKFIKVPEVQPKTSAFKDLWLSADFLLTSWSADPIPHYDNSYWNLEKTPEFLACFKNYEESTCHFILISQTEEAFIRSKHYIKAQENESSQLCEIFHLKSGLFTFNSFFNARCTNPESAINRAIVQAKFLAGIFDFTPTEEKALELWINTNDAQFLKHIFITKIAPKNGITTNTFRSSLLYVFLNTAITAENEQTPKRSIQAKDKVDLSTDHIDKRLKLAIEDLEDDEEESSAHLILN
ncbi:MAG: DUF3638 domain-containing protein [Legionella sp.]|jgi:hypothetical protein